MIEGRGRVLMPGLIDCHTHVSDVMQTATVAEPLLYSGAQYAFLGVSHARATLLAGLFVASAGVAAAAEPLTVCLNKDNQPFSSVKDGKESGFDVAVARGVQRVCVPSQGLRFLDRALHKIAQRARPIDGE